jgi:hypothetical protein
MKQTVGYSVGVAFAMVGTAIGLYCAWLGFSSAPYDGHRLGTFCGAIGALVGCTWACIGAASDYWQKRAASVAPRQAA